MFDTRQRLAYKGRMANIESPTTSLWTVQQVADACGVSRQSILAAIDRGSLQATLMGGRRSRGVVSGGTYLIVHEAARAWIDGAKARRRAAKGAR